MFGRSAPYWVGDPGALLDGIGDAIPGNRKAADAAPGNRRGLFGTRRGGFDWGNALLALLGGPQVAQSIMARRQAEQQSALDRDEEGRRMEALENSGFSKDQISAMRPEEISRLLMERLQPRQFGPEGGSMFNPATGTYERAPARYTDEGRIIDIPSEGDPRQVFDARENDIRWQTGQWGAFATDRQGRPIAPGTDIQSPVGGQQPPPAQQQPGADPAGFNPDAIFGRMIEVESGGRQFSANGSPLTSPAGALGVAQVMPGTGPEAARLAGLPWDPQRLANDPQYNATLGRAYYQEQLRTFGDPVLAAAAYNAGPGRVRQALERGGANWQSHIPGETRRYIQSIFGEGANGTQTASYQPRGNVQEQAAQGFVRAEPPAPGGYRWRPDGSLEEVPGGPGEREGRREVSEIIARFDSDPEVRQFRQARIATMQIEQLGQSGTAADDLALVFSFMHAIEPTSVVRETEFANAQNTAGIPDRIRNMYNQLLTGRRLSPPQRAEFIQTAHRLYNARARSYNEVANNYRARLRAVGVPDDQIGPLIQTAEGPQRQDRERQNQNRPQTADDVRSSVRRNRRVRVVRRTRIGG